MRVQMTRCSLTQKKTCQHPRPDRPSSTSRNRPTFNPDSNPDYAPGSVLVSITGSIRVSGKAMSTEKLKLLVVQGLKEAGVPEEHIYAYEKLGYIITEKNLHMFKKQKIKLYLDALKEYHRAHKCN